MQLFDFRGSARQVVSATSGVPFIDFIASPITIVPPLGTSVQGTATGNGQTINFNRTYTGKWIGASCPAGTN
jgi:hypothetical protein